MGLLERWKDRRQRRAFAPIGEAITGQAAIYEQMLQKSPQVRPALDSLTDASDFHDFYKRLDELARFEALIPHSHYRMAWVSRSHDVSAHVLATSSDRSVHEAKALLADLRSAICAEVGASETQVLLSNDPQDSVTITVEALRRALDQ